MLQLRGAGFAVGGSVWLWVITWWLEGPCLRPSARPKGRGARRWAGSGGVPLKATGVQV